MKKYLLTIIISLGLSAAAFCRNNQDHGQRNGLRLLRDRN